MSKPNHNQEIDEETEQELSTLDMDLLVQSLSKDVRIMSKIQDKELILFLGTTNAGKTTTICFLAGKELRIKREALFNPHGEEIIGDEVIDTVEEYEELRIGHTFDSTTSSLHAQPLPGTDIILVDSCGFDDTQGLTIDIANAVSLRNVMGLSVSLHPVIIIDVNILGVDKGVPFTKLLGLILRFFSPIDQYIPNMSFFFTHSRSHDSAREIKLSLSRLSNANHIKHDQTKKYLVDALFDYVSRYSNRCLLLVDDMISLSPDRVAKKKRDMLDLILKIPPLSKNQISTLGCPLTDESQRLIREKCLQTNSSVLSHLSLHQYSLIKTQLDHMQTLSESLSLKFVTDFYLECCEHLNGHLRDLFLNIDLMLSGKNFELLGKYFSNAHNARCLEKYFDVSKELNARILDLNRCMVSWANIILTPMTEEDNSRVCDILAELKMVKQHLGFFLLEEHVKSHGYDSVVRFLEGMTTLVHSRCEVLLKTLHKIVLSPANSETSILEEDENAQIEDMKYFINNFPEHEMASKVKADLAKRILTRLGYN